MRKYMKYMYFFTPFAVALGCASMPDAPTVHALGEKAVATSYPGMPLSLGLNVWRVQ